MTLDDDSTIELFRAYRADGSRRVRDRLITEYDWIAQRCARRLSDRGEPLADLVQVARLGLVKAVDRFDPERGYAFPAFAMPTVNGELRRHFRDTTWQVAVPRRAKDLVARMNTATSELHQQLGRAPTVDELAGSLDVDAEFVLETMEAAQCYRTSSIDESFGDRDPSAHDRLGSDDAGFAETELRVAAVAALEHLDERSRRIVLWRFYEGCTQSEIGARLGIGQVQVSRLLRAALDQMKGVLAEDPDRDEDPGNGSGEQADVVEARAPSALRG